VFKAWKLTLVVSLITACSETDRAAEEASALVARGLPIELASYAGALEKTKLPSLDAIAHAVSGTDPWVSKFRGLPYFPKNREFPKDADGNSMVMLAQVNFEEVPALDGYPRTGILQFYIAAEREREHEHVLGMPTGWPNTPDGQFNALREQKYFRVIYHDRVFKDRARLIDAIPATGDDSLPVRTEARLEFFPKQGYVRTSDYRFARVFGTNFDAFEQTALRDRWDIVERYWDFSEQHYLVRIGGYSRTEQGYDPRSARPNEDWVVLLSIDSSQPGDGVEVEWEDGGIANFWIRRDDLLRHDFSNVMYFWDCG
jgi:uncharacterized protein YwqG